jgi:hypothetical protein
MSTERHPLFLDKKTNYFILSEFIIINTVPIKPIITILKTTLIINAQHPANRMINF